jgi:hypothetical protein
LISGIEEDGRQRLIGGIKEVITHRGSLPLIRHRSRQRLPRGRGALVRAHERPGAKITSGLGDERTA